MATDNIPITFFTLAREIRDLIYAYLIPKAKAYALTSASAIAPYLGLINTSKAVNDEMLEAL